jgi:hypothetical protein
MSDAAPSEPHKSRTKGGVRSVRRTGAVDRWRRGSVAAWIGGGQLAGKSTTARYLMAARYLVRTPGGYCFFSWSSRMLCGTAVQMTQAVHDCAVSVLGIFDGPVT